MQRANILRSLARIYADNAPRLAELFRTFPTSHALSVQSMGVPEDWHTLDLWRG